MRGPSRLKAEYRIESKVSEGIVDPLSVVGRVLNFIENVEGVGSMWDAGLDDFLDLSFLSCVP